MSASIREFYHFYSVFTETFLGMFYNLCPLFEPFSRAFCLIHFHLIDTTEVERISQFLALLKHNNRTKQNVKIRLIHLY